MPSDLIYREDAKDFVRHAYHKGMNPVEYLDEVPAADVRPVKIGRYITDNMGDSSCSECGGKYLDITKRFCPECGAELRRNDGDQ